MTFFPFSPHSPLIFSCSSNSFKACAFDGSKIFAESQRQHASHEIGSFNLTSKHKTRVLLGYLELLITLINLIHMCIKNVEQWINLRIIEIKSFLIGIFGGWGHSENDIELTNKENGFVYRYESIDMSRQLQTKDVCLNARITMWISKWF